jgi:hypothetical protein
VQPTEVASERKLSERKEILKCKEWSGGDGTGKGEAKTRSAGGHGEECTSKSYQTHLWNSYGEVLQGVGRTQQQAAHQV